MPPRSSQAQIPIPFDELSAPAQRALKAAGYETLGQLALVPERDIASLHGLGPGTIKILRLRLRRNKLAFARSPRR
jgi:hypothetical protein